ncbi:MAG: malectin domain-containing carbohydrate-binding protein, partial [Phycisphaerae bacterium]
LHFAEPEPLEPGGRILNVSLEGKPVLRDFDIAKAAGGTSKAVVREFKGVQVTGELDISLSAGKGRTLICGVEIVAE